MNALLAAMSESDRQKVTEAAERVEASQFDVLQRAEDPITAAYFPETGWVSLLANLEDGRTAEVGVVGNEGMVGLNFLVGGKKASFDWIVQSAGTLLRIKAAPFVKLLDEGATVRAALVKAAIMFNDQVAQTAVCNISHTVEQRLARRLLLAHDRSQSDTLRLTQDLLAMMLGTRRAGMSVATAALKASGIVSNSRGTITILNRAALEAASCECYQAVRRRSDTLS